MSLYKGNTLIGGIGKHTVRNAHTLLDFKWSDYIINSMEWLRSDTFSWQSGSVYSSVYQHLVADIIGKTTQKDTYGDIEIWYYLADDGHKIAGPNQEQAISRVYDKTGVAWYYILDTTNERFKLPRTKWSFTGLRDTVGNNISILESTGYPQITTENRITVSRDTDYTLSNDCWVWWGNSSYVGQRRFYVNGIEIGHSYGSSGNWEEFDSMILPLKAGNVIRHTGDNSTCYIYPTSSITQYNIQTYLYFYVGQFSQSATEQTAGLNAELLNSKADVDMFKVVTELPTNPDPNVWYAILEE